LAERGFTIAPEAAGPAREIREAGRRRLPERYRTDVWDLRFRERLEPLLRPGVDILDIGAGRRPTVAPGDRAGGGGRYVGLDVDDEEMARAEPGSYDGTVVAAGEDRVPELEGGFDLCLSFFAFEHVRSTEAVLKNIAAYLRPGGTLLAQLAGARSPFSLANRILPAGLSRKLLHRSQGRAPDSVFPATYDRCTHSELSAILDQRFSESEVVPLYTGAGYVLFSRVLTAAYIGYENWLARGDRRDLAPYYLIAARR
jgi:SAM-dependent methyltransferase